jgi:hypothetical protein
VKADLNTGLFIMTKKKSILYISESIPTNTFASPVLFYRHLTRLEAHGWLINLILLDKDLEGITFPATWNVKRLPVRRWWYPPFKHHFFFRVPRYYLLWLECADFIKQYQPQFILGYVWGTYLSGFAGFLSRKLSLPAGFFLHDNQLCWYIGQKDKTADLLSNHRAISKEASIIWSVSERLRIGDKKLEHKFKVLFPIPEGYSGHEPGWKPTSATSPVLAYAGTIQSSHVPLFARMAHLLKELNGTLLIITKEADYLTELLTTHDNVEFRSPMKPVEALSFMQTHASALLICYPQDLNDVPWVEGSFPSKFVEYSHLGMPMLALTPGNTAFADWCEANHLIGYTSSYEDESLRKALALVVDEEKWKQMAAQSKYLAVSQFNPEVIHQTFEESILSIVR